MSALAEPAGYTALAQAPQRSKQLPSCSRSSNAGRYALACSRTVQCWRGRALTLLLLGMGVPATVGQLATAQPCCHMHVMLMLHMLMTVCSAALLRDAKRGAGDVSCATACAQRLWNAFPRRTATGHACQRARDAASRERSKTKSARQLDLSHGAYRAPMREVVLSVALRALGARNVCPRPHYHVSDM